MSTDTTDLDQYAEKAQTLLAHIEAGDRDAVSETLDDLTRLRETELFREVGKLTRELHEALKSFRTDNRLGDLVASEIPDAQDRLNHVIELTEDSAHRTLTALEESLETLSEVGQQGRDLAAEWQRFRQRSMSTDEFRQFSRQLDGFFERLQTDTDAVHSKLTDALMAQDYQDITGQIIRRVMKLVKEVEDGLVSLLSISGQQRTSESQTDADNRESDKGQKAAAASSELEGPQVPGHENDTAVSGQDEVDDLLSSLGF